MFGKNHKKDVEKAQSELDFSKFRYQLELDTTAGPIRLDFWPDVAPGHVNNMLGLAKIGFYDNLTFHRVVKGFVIQGGCPEGTGTGGPGYQIKAEFNAKKHEPGVLSMARAQNPDSAGSQFFICLEKVPYLDNQYTAFGQTADEESLATVRAIGQAKTDRSDRPVETVSIRSAKVTSLPL